MDEGSILCVAGLFLLAVMVIGHGMWMVAARIFRAMAGEPPRVDKPAAPTSRPAAAPTLRQELETTIQQVKRLGKIGLIAKEDCERLVAVFEKELVELAPRRPESEKVVQRAPGPALVPASAEIVDAVLVETPVAPATVHPLDRPYVPPPPRPPSQPRRSLADMLQSFMEESNIRWGEILAAMLIVLCSVGLVISLRATLKNIPYFPAILFTLFTVSFHGAGLYTLRRWKLHAVSRVILIISLLLVPLTFCGAIVLQQSRANDLLFVAALLAGTAIFTWVCNSAGRELVGSGAWPLTVGVLGASLSQVLIQRLDLAGGGLWRLNAAAAVPVFSYLAATGWQIWRARGWQQLSKQRVIQILRVLGIATFALLPPLALILVQGERRALTVARLSPLVSLAAAAALALGLIIHRRTTAKRLVAWQTTGTAILVLAGVLLLVLVAAAWPEPELLLAVGLMNCVILAVLGVVAELPLLYVPSVACAALAMVIGMHLAGGQFVERTDLSQKIVQAALMGRTSLALSALGAIVAGVAWVARRKRVDDTLMLLVSGGGLAAVSVLIALFSGFITVPGWPQDRDLAAPVLLVYALVLITAGPASRRAEVTGAGSLLLWVALVQALVFSDTIRGWLAGMQWLPERPVLTATLVHGVLTAIGALVWRRAGGSPRLTPAIPSLLEPPATLAAGAAVSLSAAIPFIVWVRGGDFSTSATMALAAAVGWAALAAGQRWPWAISGLQAMLALAPALMIAGVWREQHEGANWFLDPQHLFAQFIAAALATLPWSAARRLTSQRDTVRGVLNAPWPAVDQVLLGIGAIGLPIIAFRMALPHVGWELGFGGDSAPVSAAAFDALGAIGRGWIALAVIVVALIVSLWERITLPALAGIGVATFAAVWLGSEHFQPVISAASAARWGAATYALAWAAAFIARDPMRAGAKQVAALRWDRLSHEASHWFCAQPLLFGGTTILILTILAVQQHASGVLLRGPVAGTFFNNIGATTSYAAPLAALVAVLLGYAIRERQAGFALGGAAISQLAVNLAYLLHVDAAQPVDVRAIEWLQWNSVAAGAFALVWVWLSQWITPRTADEQQRRISDGLWSIPVALAGGMAAVLVGWAAFTIIESPAAPAAVLIPLGSSLSYLAVGLVLAAVLWRAHGRLEMTGLGDAAMWLVAGMVPLMAASINRLDSGGQWLAFHSLHAGWLGVGVIGCALVCWKKRSSLFARLTPHHLSVAVIAGCVIALAIRGNRLDPLGPWWSLGGALGACAVATGLGLARRSQLYAHASTGLLGLAVVLLWSAPAAWPWITALFSVPPSAYFAGWEVFVVALAVSAGFWLSREIASQQRLSQSFDSRPFVPRAHAVVVLGVVPFYFLYRLAAAWFLRQPHWAYDVVSVVATLGLGSVLVAALWDRRAWWTLPMLYWWGGAAWCLAIGLARPWLTTEDQRLVALVVAVAAHVALTGQIWSYGANLAAIGERWGVADPVLGLARTARWLPVVNLLLAAAVCAIALLLVLTLPTLPLRVVAAFGPAIVAWGILCLAQERRRDALQLASLLVVGLSAVYLGWAQIAPLVDAADWLAATFRLLMVLAALTFLYGLVLPRFLLTSGSWNAATRKAGYVAASAALATFVATLALEMALFQPGLGAPVQDVQVAAIAVVLLALIAGLVSLAVLPGRDPLVLSERGRQGYVYAAELTAALLFAHVYVCRPMWFGGILAQYWPFIVMGLAFLGVGSAELFERYRIRVLAEPLARTGALLPLLPVIGWWAASTQVDYSKLLLVAGILYLALSYTRKSWAAMVAAAVAGNGALWALLTNTQLSFAANPQLWLIPPALSVLVAAQINRHRLAPEMLTAIRYAATIVIYVSSTSEIVTRGFAAGLVPPMVLLGLAVAGALVGIAFRVRAFLILGSSFTLVALVAMVRHAAQSIDHVWPWWVFGIALGVAILVLFGIFEKKRPEVMQLIGRLRQWEQ